MEEMMAEGDAFKPIDIADHAWDCALFDESSEQRFCDCGRPNREEAMNEIMKHTAGVLRAVDKIIFGIGSGLLTDQLLLKEQLADIIAEETAQPELLSAAKEAVICSDEEDYEDIVALKDAIRKVEGGKP